MSGEEEEHAGRRVRVGSFMADPSTGSFHWSRRTLEIFGVDPDLLDTDSVLDNIHTDDRPTLQHLLRRAAGAGEDFEAEVRITVPGELRTAWVGCEKAVDEARGTCWLMGTVLDITAQIAVERGFAENIKDLRLAQRIARVGNWTFDPELGTPRWSEEVYRIYERDPTGGTPTLEEYRRLYQEPDFSRFQRAITAATQEGEPYDIILRLPLSGGREKWIRAICEPEPHRGPSGHLLRGTIQDITRERRLEMQLRHTQRMEAVGQLAGGVAHDFNNIITAIRGFSEVLEEETEGASEAAVEALQEIQDGCQRASSLARQLLTFSRRQPTVPVLLDLDEMLADVERMLRRLLSESIQLEIQRSGTLPAVLADRSQMEQVVMNLVLNAQDAMPEGGALVVRTATEDRPSGPWVILEVRDSGVGIEEGTLERIFEPFFTTKERGHGTGLGLATVHGIVEQARGTVTVTSQVGQGSVFTVRLPGETSGPSPKVGAGPISPRARSSGGETILLCEDDASVRHLAAIFLRDAGYHVLVAASGLEALALLDRHAGVVHLLVTDVIMPHMNGRQLADAVTARCGDVPVVFVSGYAAEVLAPHGVLERQAELLEKPFTRDGLLGRVRQILDARTAEDPRSDTSI